MNYEEMSTLLFSIKGARVTPSTGIKPRPTAVGAPATPYAHRSLLDVPHARDEGPLRFTYGREPMGIY